MRQRAADMICWLWKRTVAAGYRACFWAASPIRLYAAPPFRCSSIVVCLADGPFRLSFTLVAGYARRHRKGRSKEKGTQRLYRPLLCRKLTVYAGEKRPLRVERPLPFPVSCLGEMYGPYEQSAHQAAYRR